MYDKFFPQRIGDNPDKQGIVERLYQIRKKMSNEVVTGKVKVCD